MKKFSIKNISFERISSGVLLTIIFGFSVSIFVNGLNRGNNLPKLSFESFMMGNFVDGVEEFIGENIPRRHNLMQVVTNLKIFFGNIEQNGVYVTKDMLIEKLEKPNDSCTKNNTKFLKDFGNLSGIPVYVMLVPSKGNIKQELLPEYIPDIYSEKKEIEKVYSELAGNVSTIDAYSVLFSRRDEYIYYRTEPSLTSLGGYYIYTVLSDRLGKRPNTIDEFSMEFVEHNYYGKSYYNAPYAPITPDIITIYHHNKQNRKFIVVDNETGERFDTLYPKNYSKTPNKKDIILGGERKDISIYNGGPYDRRILIIGDNTAVPILPFLATQMSEIRYINITKIARGDVVDIKDFGFDQILFIYSLQNYIHRDISGGTRVH